MQITFYWNKFDCYVIYSTHFDRPDIKATVGKINNFSVVTSICPKYYSTQLSCLEVVKKFSFSELKFFYSESNQNVLCYRF